MYRLLVVDDEAYALKSIMETINWEFLGINEVYGAMDVEEARLVFCAQRIDVVICDIEMPGENGLELLEWLNQEQFSASVIFVTGHDRFEYVQAALRAGCFDYMLKPVRHELLLETVARSLRKLEQDREHNLLKRRMGKFEKVLRHHKQELVERFWNDVLYPAGKTPNNEALLSQLSLMEPDAAESGEFMLVLVSISGWKARFGIKDEEILEYAVMNRAEETVLENWPGAVLKSRNGELFIVVYHAQEQGRSIAELRRRCMGLVEDCGVYFYSHVKCYISLPGTLCTLGSRSASLLKLERQCAGDMKDVWVEGEQAHQMPEQLLGRKDWPAEIALLLQKGRHAELYQAVDEWFASYDKEYPLSKEDLKALYYHLLSSLYQSFNQSGISIGYVIDAISVKREGSAPCTKSLAHLRLWTRQVIEMALEHAANQKESEPTIVEQIEQYVKSRMSEEVSREEIASLLHFNPAYLSRLFKKETGSSLTDYIVSQRMEYAKKLLSESDLKVSDVAEITGYSNFSYFSRLFKKQEGYSPIEFRKRYKGEAGS
ncbi:two-component system, response regulator YesN [Paenibacillus algorifonticola]|uniref:Two-component system, response regulator YesN n=1 Tax=Paenibacillus algorifonticola TaxID=684063 RepID=A0A1I2FAZ7_9BACL|nr:response regulator [Paenibacillus algorifonticola]SFF01928.1 two-component system, response regulator YesN [Paenibacillus algorifonticola]